MRFDRALLGIDPSVNLKAVAIIGAVGLLAELAVVVLLPFKQQDPLILRRPFVRSDVGNNGYWAKVSIPFSRTDNDGSKAATLRIYENGVQLGPPHSQKLEIERQGGGRYIVLKGDGGQLVLFSTSDNSDPNTNGRVYRVTDPDLVDPYLSKPNTLPASSRGR